MSRTQRLEAALRGLLEKRIRLARSALSCAHRTDRLCDDCHVSAYEAMNLRKRGHEFTQAAFPSHQEDKIVSQNQLREAREQAEEVTRERDNWKARATMVERERDVAISMSLKRSNDLAAAQARERELRAALEAFIREARCSNGCPPDDMMCATNRANAALSAPQDTTALREFGLKVAKYAHELDGPILSAETIVDAVLKELQP